MNWRFILQVEVSGNADRFDVRGEEKGVARIILGLCVQARRR